MGVVMKRKTETQESVVQSTKLVLDETIGIETVNTFRATLENMAELERDIIIDSSQVKVIDTASIQSLVALALYVNSIGKKIIWNQSSEAFMRIVTLLNLGTWLECETP